VTRNTAGQGVVRLVPLETNGNLAHSLWVSYYRTNETNMVSGYPYGATVEVTVQAIDVKGFSLEPAFSVSRLKVRKPPDGPRRKPRDRGLE